MICLNVNSIIVELLVQKGLLKENLLGLSTNALLLVSLGQLLVERTLCGQTRIVLNPLCLRCDLLDPCMLLLIRLYKGLDLMRTMYSGL